MITLLVRKILVLFLLITTIGTVTDTIGGSKSFIKHHPYHQGVNTLVLTTRCIK